MARIIGLVIAGLCAFAASPQPSSVAQLHYLGEVGHLGTEFDQRTSAKFGHIEALPDDGGGIRVQGHDDAGKPWQADLPAYGGVGWTDIWRADFDRNGRSDLLVAAHFPQNGRCIDEITLSFLLFNDRGQPVPWVIQTRMPERKGLPAVPAIFADFNRSGRLKLVVTECSYSDPPRFGEDRQITGIYEAKDATWSLIHPSDIAPYVALVRRSYRIRPNHDELLPTDFSHWTDRGNRTDAHGPPPLQVAAVLPASTDCRGVRLPPVVDGALQRNWKDPCDEIGKDRIQLSTGAVCYGWPTLIIDQADRREIVADPRQLTPALQDLAAKRHTAVFAGQRDPERCSPTTLWALQTAGQPVQSGPARFDAEHPPRFEDFGVTERWNQTPAPVKLTSRWERLFRTRLTNAGKESPNFAGHYRLAIWGCGSECISGAVVDLKIGAALPPPGATKDMPFSVCQSAYENSGVDYRLDSRLVIVKCGLNYSERLQQNVPDTYYFVLEDGGFRRVLHLSGKQAVGPKTH